MSSRDLPKIVVRLPRDVKRWLVEQAVENASSQTSEIVRAVRERMVRCHAGSAELAHNVAVELAISVADLPKGTAIILQSASPGMKTDILVKAPSDADYLLVARVLGEEVAFADDPAANVAGTVT